MAGNFRVLVRLEGNYMRGRNGYASFRIEKVSLGVKYSESSHF